MRTDCAGNVNIFLFIGNVIEKGISAHP